MLHQVRRWRLWSCLLLGPRRTRELLAWIEGAEADRARMDWLAAQDVAFILGPARKPEAYVVEGRNCRGLQIGLVPDDVRITIDRAMRTGDE